MRGCAALSSISTSAFHRESKSATTSKKTAAASVSPRAAWSSFLGTLVSGISAFTGLEAGHPTSEAEPQCRHKLYSHCPRLEERDLRQLPAACIRRGLSYSDWRLAQQGIGLMCWLQYQRRRVMPRGLPRLRH